jgi:hypothetical protein
MERKRALMTVFLLFAAVYYVARIAIFYAGVTGNMEFEEDQSALVEGVVSYSFLAIGVTGLLLLPGVYLLRLWGFWGTIAVSMYTIAFDAWAFFTVQSSAAAGVIPAAALAGYLIITRSDFTLNRTESVRRCNS